MIKNCSNCGRGIAFACPQKYEYVCDKHLFPQGYGTKPLILLANSGHTNDALLSHVIPLELSLPYQPDASTTALIADIKRDAMLKSDAIWIFGELPNNLLYDIETAQQSGVPVYRIHEQREFPQNAIIFELLQIANQIGVDDDIIKIKYSPNYQHISFYTDYDDELDEPNDIVYDLSDVPETERDYLMHRISKLPFGLYTNADSAKNITKLKESLCTR